MLYDELNKDNAFSLSLSIILLICRCHLQHTMMLEEELDKDNAYRQATDRPIEDDNRTAVGQV
jgi:hypothetical protein